METMELLNLLEQQGVQLKVEDNGKLSIRSPKGVLTPELQANLAACKQEIVAKLQEQDQQENPDAEADQEISLQTIGRLIGGFSEQKATGFKPPLINSQLMAKKLTITFKPLPINYQNQTVIQFREELATRLKSYGVKVEPWEQATAPLDYDIHLPLIHRRWKIKSCMVRMHVNTVIDVERPLTLKQRVGIWLAETLYQLYSLFFPSRHPMSVARIAKLSSWAEEHAAKYIEDPNHTQIIVITELDQKFVNSTLAYQEKIKLGLNTLVRTFSEIVIGVSPEKISILNMNLSDSVYTRENLDRFVFQSLIPKVFVPIAPLLLDRFELGTYNPVESTYAAKLVNLGQKLATTGLFPPGYKLSELLKRKSHRDIVNVIVNGRTGVSYGFLAYAEPPTYVGPKIVNPEIWANLIPVSGFNPAELRQNNIGRRYLKTRLKGEVIYQQIPDIWVLSSRSGCNKTDLNLNQDVLRIGLKANLQLQLPSGVQSALEDIKPSYDIYVMLAIALAAALYTPDLVEHGAAMVHFHGYPTATWFKPFEYYTGTQNPSVPCGTYESGIFNFLGIYRLAHQASESIALACLIEPDHGSNIIAADVDYLTSRLIAGSIKGQIDLGGKNFASLK